MCNYIESKYTCNVWIPGLVDAMLVSCMEFGMVALTTGVASGAVLDTASWEACTAPVKQCNTDKNNT